MKSLIALLILLSSFCIYSCDIPFDEYTPDDKKSKAIEALNFLKRIRGSKSSKLHQKFFNGNVNSDTYCKYLEDNISYLGYWESDTNYPVFMENFGGNVDYGSVAIESNYVAVAIALLHEAYHTKGASHVPCKKRVKYRNGKSLKGISGCDNSLDSAYSYQIVAGENISRYCDTCTAKEKEYALEFAQDFYKRILNPVSRAKLKLDRKL